MDVYVYYRVPVSNAERLQACVLSMQAGLAKRFALATALKRRPKDQNGTQTWMEIYMALPAEIAEEFVGELELAAAQSELSSLIEGGRHIERFVDVVPCA